MTDKEAAGKPNPKKRPKRRKAIRSRRIGSGPTEQYQQERDQGIFQQEREKGVDESDGPATKGPEETV